MGDAFVRFKNAVVVLPTVLAINLSLSFCLAGLVLSDRSASALSTSDSAFCAALDVLPDFAKISASLK